MKILITGSEGFIGKPLFLSLENEGHDVTGIDLKNNQDLKDWEYVNTLDDDFDLVFHLAAFNGTKWFYEKPVDVIRDNVFATENILKKYSGKVEKIIFSGTCESYAGSTEYFNYKIPTDEKVPLTIVDPSNVRWSYGGSKLLNEIMVWSYSKQFNQEMIILRYHNVYGYNQVDHFIPEFINRVKQNDYSLFGYDNTRSFIFIDDAIEITKKVSFSEKSNNKTVNIGNSKEYTIKEIAEIILVILNKNNKLELFEAPIGSVKRRCPDCSLQNEIIGSDFQFLSIKEGIKKIIN